MRNRTSLSLHRRGFSVTELLVVVVVSGILITSLFGMLKQDTEVQLCLDDQSSDLRRSRIAADLLFNDVIQAGARVVRVPMDSSATAPPKDYQPAYELLGPDFLVFNADLDPNFQARTTPITYAFHSAGAKTLPGPSLQMSRADSQAPTAGTFGYAGAETIAYFALPDPSYSAANNCAFILYRQVNDNEPEIVQRGVRTFDYKDPGSACNGAPTPAATDRLPVGPLFSYWGFFTMCLVPPCTAPQLWGDGDNNGALSPAEYKAAKMADALNFQTGDRFGGAGKVANSECVWTQISGQKAGQPAIWGCDYSASAQGVVAADINGTGKIEESLGNVVHAINLQLTVESPLPCDNYQQNAGFVRNQVNLTIRPPNPPLRGVGCKYVPHNLKSLKVIQSTATCDLECGRSVFLQFPVSVDDPFYTAGDVPPDLAERDVVSYNVYSRINGVGNFSQVASMPPSDTSGADYQFTVTGLDPSNQYDFKVKPVDCSGNESPEAPLPTAPELYTQLPVIATLLANPPNQPACAVPSANGMICSPDTVLLTWGYADPKPATGGKFIIEVQDSAGAWAPATLNGNADIDFVEQNGVAGTQFRSGDCNTASAAGIEYPDCYFALVNIPDKVNNYQYRILPPAFSGCYCGNCNPVTICDWCTSNTPVCQVVDDPCNPVPGQTTLMVTWNSFELELCSGLGTVPELIGYRLMRDYSGGAAISTNQITQDPLLLKDGQYLVRELAEDAQSGECSLPANYPVGSTCTAAAPGPYDPKGDPLAEGGYSNYPRASTPGYFDAMTDCPTGSTGDPSDTEIHGAPVSVCSLSDPVNVERGYHRYREVEYYDTPSCQAVGFTLATKIKLPMADASGVTEKFFLTECLGAAIPNQDGFEEASSILSPDPWSDELPYMGKFDNVGPTYLAYGSTDLRLEKDACYEIPSTDPLSPLIADKGINNLLVGLQVAQAGLADPALANIELVRYTTGLDDLPVMATANPDITIPNSKIVDFGYSRRNEIDGSGWHDKSDRYSWPTLLGVENTLKNYPVAVGDAVKHEDPKDSLGGAAMDYFHSYHYRSFSTGTPYYCGTGDFAPRTCSYGFTNYIPARPEPVFANSQRYEFGVVDNGIKFNADPTAPYTLADLPAINLEVSASKPAANEIEILGFSRSDCEYPDADTCKIPDPTCPDVSYRWFRRVCDASSPDPAANCTAPVLAGDIMCLSVVDQLNQLTINSNALPIPGQAESGIIWDQVIRGTDLLGNSYRLTGDSDSVANTLGQMVIPVPDCDAEGAMTFYYTLVAERSVTMPDGSQRTLYSEPSPLIKLDCKEEENCGQTTCEPNHGDPYGNNWGMVCMNEVGKPLAGENLFRMQGASYEMVINLANMAITSYKHYNPGMALPHPQTGLPVKVTEGYYEYVDQKSGIPLVLAYDSSQKDKDDLPLGGLATDGGPFIGGDDTQWTVKSHTKRGPFEQELIAYFGGNSERMVTWRFHPDTVMLHIEWGGSNSDFFTVVNTSPNRGNSGYYDAATADRRPRNMMLSAPDDLLTSATWGLPAAPGDHNYRMDNWAGTPVKKRCDEVTGWETLPLSRRQLAIWSSAGLPDALTDPYDADVASPSILTLEWQEKPSAINQSQNLASTKYDRHPLTQWLYGAATAIDEDDPLDGTPDRFGNMGEAYAFSRRESKSFSSGAGLELQAGCTPESSVTSIRVPAKDLTINNLNFLDLVFKPLFKTRLTGTNGAKAYSDKELYTHAWHIGAVEVAVPFFANREVVLVSEDKSAIYPNYMFAADGSTLIWTLGLDSGSPSFTSADPNPTFSGGSEFFEKGSPLIYIPEWGGYVLQLTDPAIGAKFEINYNTDRTWDDDGSSPYVPLKTGWDEGDVGTLNALPLPQPRIYMVKWNNDASNTAALNVKRDSDDVDGSCVGLSMTMFRDGNTDKTYGAMGALSVTFENTATYIPVGWPLGPGTLTTTGVTDPVIIELKSGSRPDTAN